MSSGSNYKSHNKLAAACWLSGEHLVFVLCGQFIVRTCEGLHECWSLLKMINSLEFIRILHGAFPWPLYLFHAHLFFSDPHWQKESPWHKKPPPPPQEITALYLLCYFRQRDTLGKCLKCILQHKNANSSSCLFTACSKLALTLWGVSRKPTPQTPRWLWHIL